MDTLTNLYCLVDDFMQDFIPQWSQYLLANGTKRRIRPCRLSASEVMTIVINFQQSNYRDFKHYYLHHVTVYLAGEFPKLVSSRINADSINTANNIFPNTIRTTNWYLFC